MRIEDWELLQVHSEILEGGGLLKGLSVVYLHQTLRLRIPIHTNNRRTYEVISLVVRDISTLVDHESSSPWPKFEDGSEDKGHNDKPTYGLLRSDTEVLVTPKVRTIENAFDATVWSEPLQVTPALQDIGQDLVSAVQRVTALHPIQYVDVGRIFINPSSCHWSALSGFSQWVEVRLFGGPPSSCKLAKVVFSRDVRESFAGRCTPGCSGALHIDCFCDEIRYRIVK
jgi:Peroxisome biogenesis factor 1, N-terminal